MAMEKGNELFLIMSSGDFRYCLYRVCEPETDEDENIIYALDEPLMKLHEESCPDGMSFASVGTDIFMVGGYYAHCEKEPFRLSNETIILDTLTNTYSRGPSLISPKPDPFLFTVGRKLFALSCDIYANSGNRFVGPKPRFEVLNTDDLKSGWRALSVPRLYVTEKHNMYPIVSCVALSIGIFISVEDAGTYAFDLDTEVWKYVSVDRLPFSDQAVPMPPNFPGAPSSLCFAASTKGHGYSAFRLCYETEGVDDNHVFKVDEIEFDCSLLDLATPLPPQIYYDWPLIATDNASVVYLIDTGLDNVDANNTNDGNRYIKVQVCDVEFSKRQLLTKLGKRKVGYSNTEFLKKCSSSGRKRGHEADEEKVKADEEKVKADEEKAQGDEEKAQDVVENRGEFSKSSVSRSGGLRGVLKRCTNSGQKSEFEDDGEKAKVETHEFKLTPIWRRSFFGGPMVDIGEHAYAAFAIKR